MVPLLTDRDCPHLTGHTGTLVQPVRGEVDAAGLPGRVVRQVLGQLHLVRDGGLTASIVVPPAPSKYRNAELYNVIKSQGTLL